MNKIILIISIFLLSGCTLFAEEFDASLINLSAAIKNLDNENGMQNFKEKAEIASKIALKKSAEAKENKDKLLADKWEITSNSINGLVLYIEDGNYVNYSSKQRKQLRDEMSENLKEIILFPMEFTQEEINQIKLNKLRSLNEDSDETNLGDDASAIDPASIKALEQLINPEEEIYEEPPPT